MNKLLTQYPEEIEFILKKYPPEHLRAAVIPLLYLAQRPHGRLEQQDLADVAEILDISVTDATSIAGYYTLFHEEAGIGRGGGRYRIQVCTDLPCALRGAKEFYEKLCQALALPSGGGTTSDGLITVEEVKCLAACHRAPLFQLQGDGKIDYYEEQTLESVLGLVEDLRRSAAGAEVHSDLTTTGGEVVA